jgi:hypothetical protein
MLVAGCWILDAGSKKLLRVAGCRLQDKKTVAGCELHVAG